MSLADTFSPGYYGRRQQIQQEGAVEMQRATQAMNLAQMLQKQQQEGQLRELLAQTDGDVDKALAIAVKSGNIAAAHQLAPLVEIQRKKEESSALGKLDMTDPAALRSAAMVLKKPELLTHAERIDKQRTEAGTLRAMQSGAQVLQPDPQELSQAADQGTPVPQPAEIKRGGIFDDLANSQIPHIAQAAKNMQAQLDRSGATIPAAYWQKQHETLAARESAYMQQKSLADIKKGDAAMPIIPAQHADKHGDDFLKTLPAADRALVKKIASYDIDPKTLSIRGGHREKMLALVSQYNPDYDDTQYANKRKAISQFGSGPQGNTVRSLNVAIEHIDTLQRASDALNNGEFTPGNKVFNEVAKVFGKTPPNTFEGIRDIVANEVIKGTIGNAGALQDRAEAAAKVKAASSPKQLKELMNGWTELMGGQIKGLERQYESSTKNKDFRERYLTQRTRDAVALSESKVAAPATAKPAGDGWTIRVKPGNPSVVGGATR